MSAKTQRKISVKKSLFILAVLAVLVTLLRLPAVEEPFDGDSGATAYHARLILRGEPLYSTHHPSHHMPAVYYTYAAAFQFFGDSTQSVKILLIPWTILTAYLIYLLGIKLNSHRVGFLAAGFYAILNSHILLRGTGAKSELFANLPITAAILLGSHLIVNRSNSWKYLFVGVLGAFAMLFKLVFIAPMVIGFLLITIDAWYHRQSQNNLRDFLYRGIWMALGWFIVMGLVTAYFAWLDLLPRYLMVFTLGREYVDELASKPHWISVFILPIYTLAINNVLLVLFSFAGSLNLSRLVLRSRKVDYQAMVMGASVLVWFTSSIIIAGYTRRGWPHYSLIIIPPLAILAAWEINRLFEKIQIKGKTQSKATAPIFMSVLLILVLAVSAISNSRLYYHYVRYKLGLDTYQEFLLSDIHDGKSFVLMEEVAQFIRSNTTKDDYIYSWSDQMQIYYLTDRRAPIDMIWPIYVDTTGSYRRIFNPQTKFIIVGTSQVVTEPDWLRNELELSYQVVNQIGSQRIYQRLEQ